MSVNVGDLLTATAAPVTGNPTPTRSWQWFRGTTAISGANGSTYTVQIDDLGFTLSVQQIETNLMGVRRAASAPTSEVSPSPSASGGTETVITQGGKFYRVHTFLSDGALTVTRGGAVEYLVIAGGGGGGLGRFNAGGGGGAGGWQKYVDGEAGNTGAERLSVSAGVHSVAVGSGGVAPAPDGNAELGENGENSEFISITALGGGGGGITVQDAGRDGGSGGGGGVSSLGGVGSQGNDGGFGSTFGDLSLSAGGGGGGAGQKGEDAAPSVGGAGGDGLASAIDGVSAFRAAGGGGSSRTGTLGAGGAGGGGAAGREDAAGAGVPNTGSGGGGRTSTGNPAGNGGSGIVIVRYQISQAEYNAEAA